MRFPDFSKEAVRARDSITHAHAGRWWLPEEEELNRRPWGTASGLEDRDPQGFRSGE